MGGQNLNFAVPINQVKGFIHSYPKMSINEFTAKVSKSYSFYNLGKAAYYTGDFNSAIDYFKQAIAIDSSCFDAQIALGEIYLAAGLVDEQIAQFQKVIGMDPNNWEAHLNLGMAYGNKGMNDQAISEFKKTIALAPNNVIAHDNLGVVYERKGMFDGAIAEHKIALGINPGYAWAHNNIAVAYYDAGQYDLAVKHCDKAMALGFKVEPRFLEKLKPYRKIVAVSANTNEGIIEFPSQEDKKTLTSLDEETKRLFGIALDALQKGDTNLALEYINKMLSRLHKESKEYQVFFKFLVAWHAQLGRDYHTKGFLDDAIEQYEKALSLIGNSQDAYLKQQEADCYFGIATIRLEKGDISKLHEYVQKLHSLNTPYANKQADILERNMRGY